MDRRVLLQWAAGAGCTAGCGARALTAEAAAAPSRVDDQDWVDTRRDRKLPLRVRWPADTLPVPGDGLPVLLYSHGLGGSRAGGEVWGQAWAAAGFVVVHLQHPGSDIDALRGVERPGRLRDAASPQQWAQRLADVGYVLDQITQRQARQQGPWARVRAHRAGLAGHSFGAHTTLAMAGQRWPGLAGVDEARLGAFVALSPTAPASDAVQALAAVRRPMLCISGSRDGDVLGNGATPERRLAVYEALPAGHKALLWLQDADHMSLAGQAGRAVEILPREPVTRALQARHHALVARVSTDWWLATLRDDAAAAARLVRPQGLADADLWAQG